MSKFNKTSITEDFAAPPTYSQTRISNESYTNVTTIRTDSDGTVSQSIQIITKR